MYSFNDQLVGTNQYLWNQCLANIEGQYKKDKKTNHSVLDLFNWYAHHKKEIDWLKYYPVTLTGISLKDLTNVHKLSLNGICGYSKFKAKNKTKKSFTIDLTKSHISKAGHFQFKKSLYGKLMRSERLDRYSNPRPKAFRAFEDRKGWHISIQYEVDYVKEQATKEPVGINRNVRQCYDSNGIKYQLKDLMSLKTGLNFYKNGEPKR